MNIDQLWDTLLEKGIATNEKLILVTKMVGYTYQSLLRVLYIRTGYGSIEQYLGQAND